jgi:hypothetical protein
MVAGSEAQHGPEGQRPPAKLPGDHRHQPVRRKQFVPAARTALLNIGEESIGMKHQHPISERGVNHRARFRSRARLNTGAGREITDTVFDAGHVHRLLGQHPNECEVSHTLRRRRREDHVNELSGRNVGENF